MKIYNLAIILTIVWAVAACDSTKIQAASERERSAGSVEKERNVKAQTDPRAAVTPSAVAGIYNYEVERQGDEPGFVNSLAVEDKGKGVLAVYFNAASIYRTGDGAESSHEASAGGDLILRGNTAGGKITQDDGEKPVGAPCRVTIAFAPEQATVKSDGCGFGVSIDGVYRKEKIKPQAEEEYVAHVEFDRLQDFMYGKNVKAGEEFVVEGVPMIKRVESTSQWDTVPPQGDYALIVGDDAEEPASFFVSGDLLKDLRPHLKTRADHLRVECVLIVEEEPAGDFRTAYVTAIEAVDAGGKTLWRVAGAKPQRVKF